MSLYLAALLCATGAHAVDLTGAGATFPKPLYDKWSAEYSRQHPDVHINYQGIGSGDAAAAKP